MTKHNIVPVSLSGGHRGEYDYECIICGAKDWIPSYGKLQDLNFFNSPCVPKTKRTAEIIPLQEPEPKPKKCSFCGKQEKHATKMFSNGADKCICGDCVALAKQRIADHGSQV